jgi:competence protein ComEA
MAQARHLARAARRSQGRWWWGTAVVIVGVSVYYVGTRAPSTTLTRLPGGRVTPSLFPPPSLTTSPRRATMPDSPSRGRGTPSPLGLRIAERPPSSGPARATVPLMPAPLQSSGVSAPDAARVQSHTAATVELNSASLAALETLPGITREYAQKIIAGRPFHSFHDVELAGIPPAIIEQITPPAMLRWTEPVGSPAVLPSSQRSPSP